MLSENVAALCRQATPLPEPLRYGNVLARIIVLVSLNKITVLRCQTVGIKCDSYDILILFPLPAEVW